MTASKANLLALLREAYVAIHREGWEPTRTIDEVAEDIRDVLDAHDMLPIFEEIEEVP